MCRKFQTACLRSEWATRIAQQLRLEEPVLRAALSKAAAERRSGLKVAPELVGRAAKPVERRLSVILAEADKFSPRTPRSASAMRDCAPALKQKKCSPR